MTHSPQPDLGPLNWVKGEIDLALARARESLDQAAASTDPVGPLQFAQTHLHQARGALSIVGLDGLAQFTDAVDRLLAAQARGDIDPTPERLALAHRGVTAIGNYLDELAHGAPDRPLRLADLYAEVGQARGDAAHPADLFFPDLGLRPPRRAAEPAPLAPDEEQRHLRALRGRFERGLLKWLRTPADPEGPREMREVVAGIEARQSSPAVRGLWWASVAFFDGLMAETPADLAAARKLCTRIDAQMRRLLSGAPPASERVMRELLHHIATHPLHTEHQTLVAETFQLAGLLPEPGSAVRDTPLEPIIKQLRETLAAARDAWGEFSAGTAVALPRFADRIANLKETAASLGRPLFTRLATCLDEFTGWLRRDPLQLSPPLAMEVASAMLLAESAVDPSQMPASLALRVDEAVARIQAHMGGASPSPDLSNAAAEAARRHEERDATAHLARELLTTLAQVEQGLDTYFRNPAQREHLSALAAPLTQLSGALTLLEDPAPQALVEEAATTIRGYADAEPDPASFEALAHQLSALGFYLEALRQGPARLADFLPGASAPTVEVEEAAPVAAVVEAVLAAPLLAEEALLPADEDLEVEAVAPIPPPSAHTQELMAAPEEALDAELLAIFMEEAHDVLDTIASHLVVSRANPADQAALTTIRRGFHTLKGSGRMVGLKDLGEAAWGLEQTLNRWLQLEWPPTPALHALIEEAHRFFNEWVAQLEAGGSTWKDATRLANEAERLRSSETPIEEPAPAEVALETAREPRDDTTAADQPADAPVCPVAEAPLGEESAAEDLLGSLEFDMTPSEEEAPAAATIADADEGTIQLDAEPEEILDLEPVATATETAAFDHAEDIADLEESDTLALEDLETALEAESIATLDAEELELPEPAAPAPDLSRDDAEVLPTTTAGRTASPREHEEESLEDYLGSLEQLDVIELAEASATRDEEEIQMDLAELETLAEVEAQETLAALEEPESLHEDEAEVSDTLRLGDTEISRPLHDLFLAEARQHLATLRRELARLHVNPTLLPPEPAIRAAHTLAGISGTAQVEAAHQLARALEQAQNRLHDTATPPSPEQTDILTAAATTLEAMVAQVAELRQPLATPELAAQLEGIARLPMADIRPFTLIQGEGRPAAASHPALDLVQSSPPPRVAEEDAPALQDDIDEQLLPIFREEGQEVLNEIGAALRAWREEPAAAARQEHLARLLHTLKGSARMAGAMSLGAFVHQQESRLENARAHASEALIDEIEAAMDTAGEMLHGLTATSAVTSADPTPAAVAIPTGEAEAGAAGASTLRVRSDLVDRFVNEAGEIGIARTRVEGELRTLRRSLLDLTENVIRLRNQLREVEIQAEVQMHSRIAQAESRHGDFDPLEMDRYTRLQELTRMMAESVGDVTTIQQNLLRNLDGADAAVNSQARLSRDLQQALMRVRMVRFDSLADRLYRILRQSAKELGKRANLDLRGGAIEIDRGVLEHMTAPLEHLLRNAVAHGLESVEARLAAGKPEIGEITLTVSQEGNEIVVDLADDGAGLNFQRILEKAQAQGLLAPDEVADEKRLTNLIFVPGFSTAGSVSALSGRGVGMDVVKAETAAVGGRIDVQSTPGAGTHFRVYLPLTLAVTQALLVRAAHHTYAIPSSMVAQVLEMKPESLEKLRQEGSTEWMGDRFSYRYLPRLLGDRETQPEVHKFNWVLLLRAGAQTLALHVDGLRGNQEIVVKNAGPQLARIVGMSGATVLGDGEIVLILNPVALASRQLAGGDDVQSPGVIPMESPSQLPTVLVVDDSLTVRKITSRLLEREGYRVVTAKDGVDALEKLLDDAPDVILSDIEMPRMDGFDLLRNIRADKRLGAVPVIMITSRLAEKHRRYAMEIGANHYLGKPYQEEELLGLIQGYVSQVETA